MLPGSFNTTEDAFNEPSQKVFNSFDESRCREFHTLAQFSIIGVYLKSPDQVHLLSVYSIFSHYLLIRCDSHLWKVQQQYICNLGSVYFVSYSPF